MYLWPTELHPHDYVELVDSLLLQHGTVWNKCFKLLKRLHTQIKHYHDYNYNYTYHDSLSLHSLAAHIDLSMFILALKRTIQKNNVLWTRPSSFHNICPCSSCLLASYPSLHICVGGKQMPGTHCLHMRQILHNICVNRVISMQFHVFSTSQIQFGYG